MVEKSKKGGDRHKAETRQKQYRNKARTEQRQNRDKTPECVSLYEQCNEGRSVIVAQTASSVCVSFNTDY